MVRPFLIALTLVVIGLAPAFGRAAAQSGPQDHLEDEDGPPRRRQGE